ncbi:hypothetical protein ATF69_2464 [Acidovorax delafieldii]|uniref:Uncharacterized protein n=1 Tax=Acidovorax delafieldii TaxID=47920 RepID=A0A561XMT5_ACIDE|nr:hypothetical protein ATF69_2464 [Acidovorax delafieldii]
MMPLTAVTTTTFVALDARSTVHPLPTATGASSGAGDQP